ncbi:site-2 protease family protein [Streptomyces sp. NPDC002742]|uniref:site-2 protease family protein n=1 Tax=Streptomyces sp. NPDC002742 TaxID=3364663 RepID=UPI003683E356
MDESGGSGQPRSGTGEAAEHHERPQASAGPASDARPGPAGPETTTGPAPTAPGHDSRTGTDPDADTGTRAHADTPARPQADSPTDAGAASHTQPGPHDDTTPEDRTRSKAHPTPAPEPAAHPGTSLDPLVKAPASTERTDREDGTEETEQSGAPGEAHEPSEDPSEANEPSEGPSEAHDDEPTPTDHDEPADAHRTRAHTGTGKARPPRRGKEPGGGLLMGRPFGVPVYVAPSWFLVAALITWVFGGQLDRVLPELGAARYLVSLFFAVAFYASVLVHELAHTVAALRFKLPVRRIQLQFFGGVSEIEKEAETPGREFVLAFVGPLLSLILSGLFYLAMLPVEPGTVPGVLLAGLMISNLIVAAFNLLPGLPLDGGRMLRAVVWKITGRAMSGTVAAAWVGRALAVSVLIGLPLLTQSQALGAAPENVGSMDTITDALLAAILAAIIWTGAGNSLRMARLREHLPELRARSLTRRAVPVETSTPLSEALRRANDVGARALVVVDADGQPLSLVREAAIVGVPEHRRPWVAVSGLAQDLTDGMRVSAELAGEDLLDALRASPATEYLVVEDSGEIYGVLSAADVERAFVKAMARPS